MSSFVAYQEMVAAQNNFDVFCNQCRLNSYNLINASEVRAHGTIDTIIRFLKWLKYHVSEGVRKVLRWLRDKISYDNYLITKNTIRCKRIEVAFNKLDSIKKEKINKHFIKRQMSISWKKDDFKKEIETFKNICEYGANTLVGSIDSDIKSITKGDNSWIHKLSELDSMYNVHYNMTKHNFIYKSKYEEESGLTFEELEFSGVEDIIELCKNYTSDMESYNKVVKLPEVLHKFEYQLDISIRDIQQDPMLANDIKKIMNDMNDSINLAIRIVRDFINFVRSMCTSINVRISAMLNAARECVAKQDESFTGSGNEAYMKETTIVITSDEEFNKRYQMLSSAVSCIMDFNTNKIYPELTLQCEKVVLKEFPGIREFCKRQNDVVKLPIKLVIDPPNDVLKMDIIADINRCVQNTGLVISLDREDWLVASIYTDAPSMEVMLDRATLFCDGQKGKLLFSLEGIDPQLKQYTKYISDGYKTYNKYHSVLTSKILNEIKNTNGVLKTRIVPIKSKDNFTRCYFNQIKKDIRNKYFENDWFNIEIPVIKINVSNFSVSKKISDIIVKYKNNDFNIEYDDKHCTINCIIRFKFKSKDLKK